MIGAGQRVPAARVWPAPREESVDIASLAADGPCLLLFYLYDWSPT